jgi:hypothetical protein
MIMTDTGMDSLPLTWGLVGIIGGVAGSTAFLTWFVRDQFSRQTHQFYRIISKHNKEDDDRFEAISTDLWNIRVHLAQSNGRTMPERKTFPRRGYLVSDNDTENGHNDG